MRKIPKSLIREMVADPFYRRCCITGRKNERIEFHHAFIFSGSQLNEKWCILPLAKSIHADIVYYKDRCEWIMLNRANLATLSKYSKALNLISLRGIRNKKFGKWTPDWYAKIKDNETDNT